MKGRFLENRFLLGSTLRLLNLETSTEDFMRFMDLPFGNNREPNTDAEMPDAPEGRDGEYLPETSDDEDDDIEFSEDEDDDGGFFAPYSDERDENDENDELAKEN